MKEEDLFPEREFEIVEGVALTDGIGILGFAVDQPGTAFACFEREDLDQALEALRSDDVETVVYDLDLDLMTEELLMDFSLQEPPIRRESLVNWIAAFERCLEKLHRALDEEFKGK